MLEAVPVFSFLFLYPVLSSSMSAFLDLIMGKLFILLVHYTLEELEDIDGLNNAREWEITLFYYQSISVIWGLASCFGENS